MDQIKNGWFCERNDLWPGQYFALEVENIICHETSDYQDIVVLQTKSHGRALVLDGIIQCTEKDEFSYQEMIAFLPLCAHKNPENVLIVGGGDGGVAREVCKHPKIKHIMQVEIDQKVIDASRKYLPFMSKGFDSPKLTLKVCDGFEFISNHKSEYDVIITDSSDPIGPATNLFTEAYFKLLKDALKPDGIICSQGGTIWSQLHHVQETVRNCRKHFSSVKYAVASVPTYPTGQIGFVIGALAQNAELINPIHKYTTKELSDMGLRYYNSNIHSASFVLPNFAQSALQ